MSFLVFIMLAGFIPSIASASDSSTAPSLAVLWTAAGIHQNLKNWNNSKLLQLKRVMSRERDLASGKTVKWEGVLMSSLLDSVLESLPNESRAQIDLIVLKNRAGQSAFIPRAMISKYPLMLAFQGDLLSDLSKIHSVVPWNSKPKILREDLPIESFYMSDITQFELTNYHDRFSSFFLKRRTNPSAIRGEKLFIQNCVSCHRVERSLPQLTKAALGHPTGTASFKLTERDRRSIICYLEAHRLENPVSASTWDKPVDSKSNTATKNLTQ